MDTSVSFQTPAKDHTLKVVVAKNVRALIDALDTSQERFSMIVGLAPETMRSILAAKNDLRLSTVQQMANQLGIGAHHLIDPEFDASAVVSEPMRVMLHGFAPDLHSVPISPRRTRSDRRRPQQLPLLAAAK